jgi:hypothetical protein
VNYTAIDHDTTDDGQAVWPQCTACNRPLWPAEASRWACRRCEDDARGRLGQLGSLFTALHTDVALVRGAGPAAAGASGSDVPPLPGRLTVLDLVSEGGVATRLGAIEEAWRKILGRRMGSWPGSPREAVPVHIAFLKINLEWACERYEEVGQDLAEIRRLRIECAAALQGSRRPGAVKVGVCPVVLDSGERCRTQLTARATAMRITCGGCGAHWQDVDGWRQLAHDQAMLADVDEAAAAA